MLAVPLITVIGSLNIDFITRTSRIPLAGETLRAQSFATGCGGKGANQAVACGRLSRGRPPPSATSSEASSSDVVAPPAGSMLTVRMIGAVGSDVFGPQLLASLESNGVDNSGVAVKDGEITGVAVVIVDEATGENRILITPGANDTLRPEQFSTFPTPLPSIVVLVLEIPLATAVQIVKAAREVEVPVLLNPSPAPEEGLPEDVYKGVTHLVMNQTEAEILSKAKERGIVVGNEQSVLLATARFFHDLGVQTIIITLGGEGVFWSTDSGKTDGSIVAESVRNVVDTTAAGDTFVGAYAVALVKGASVARAASWANKAAAKTVQKEGAMTAIPWLNEVPVLSETV